ncbi:MAG: hypothetical protein AAF789_08595 [Bacteroidota bacterium]
MGDTSDNPGLLLKYDRDHCKIYHEQDPECIRIVWNGFSKPLEFIEACDHALTFLVEYKLDKLLVDNRKSSVVSKENQDWLLRDWYPRAYRNGYRTSAVVIGKNTLNQMSIKKIELAREGTEFNTKHFEDIDSARQWLKSMI